MLAKIPWLSIGRFLLIVLCLVLVLGLVVTILPIHLDITAFKGSVEGVLSTVMEAPVTLEQVTLHPSLWPTLRILGVEVAGSGWEGAPPIALIDTIELKFSLLGLLRHQVKLKRLHVAGVHIRAHRPEGRSGNWPVWGSDSTYRITELADIELESAILELTDHHTVQTRAIIDHLTGDISENRPLNLQLQGTLEESEITLAAGGPTLATLTQASDFPLALELGLADLALDLEGTVSREPKGTKFLFSFHLDSADLAVVRQLGFAELPSIGGAQLSGQISNRDGPLHLTDLKGSIGATTVLGHLSLESREENPPRLSGRLSLGQFDLAPWLADSESGESDTSAPLPLSVLSALDTDLRLTLQELTGLETQVQDLSLELLLEDGNLSVPVTLRVADIPLSANLAAVADDEVAELDARIWARELTFRQLDGLVGLPENLDGSFGTLDLGITSSGRSAADLWANVSLEATAKDSRVSIENDDKEQPIESYLGEARATHRQGSPLTATAKGALFDEEFVLDLQTAPLADLIETDRWPLRAALTGAGATIELEGGFEQETTGLDFAFDFSITGDRLGDLSSWVGFPSDLALAYSMEGRWESAADIRLVHLEDGSIGRTRFDGEFARNTEDDQQPFMVSLHAYTLDLRELLDVSESVATVDTEEERIGVDIPILPSQFTFHDAELELTVDRLLREMVDLTDVSASIHFREGRLDSSPFSFTYDTQQFDGEINLDLREEIPRFSLELHGDGDRLGEILEREGLAKGFQITAKQLDFRIDASGASLRQIIQSADIGGRFVDVHWRMHPPEFDEPLRIDLGQVDLSGPRGQPIVLTASGHTEKVPVDLRFVLRMPEDVQEALDHRVPFEAQVGLAATDIELRGEVLLPITSSSFDFLMRVEGESLATLSVITDSQLPDIGPYRLSTRAVLTDEGYSFKDLDIAVRESDIRGELQYLRIDGRPTFSADLSSQRLRTEDFLQVDSELETGPETTNDQDVDTKKTEVGEAKALLPELGPALEKLKGFDATIELRAEEIVTLGGKLDTLRIDADLHHGSFDLAIERSHPDVQDPVGLTAGIRPWGDGIETEIQASWDREPYGMFADILNPSKTGGSWSVDLDLQTHGSSWPELMANLSGDLNFADYPDGMSATIFDLWSGGLIQSILPVFQLGPESTVNCTVVKFQVTDGVLTPDLLFVDSTRTRVAGKGTIDLPANKIKLTLKPRPKQRNLINLSTPVKIRGSLTDPDVQISKGGMAVTFFRLSLWVYTVWRDLIRKPLPADGSDICVEPFTTKVKQ